jgi:hypothetical protein
MKLNGIPYWSLPAVFGNSKRNPLAYLTITMSQVLSELLATQEESEVVIVQFLNQWRHESNGGSGTMKILGPVP